MPVTPASDVVPYIPRIDPATKESSNPPTEGPPIFNVPLEIRRQFFRHSGSLAEFTNWLKLNRQLHAEGMDFMPDINAELVDHAVCKWMGDYYEAEAQQDPARTSQVSADHYQQVLTQTKTLFTKVKHVRLGLAYSEPAEGSTGIPAPSYWPSQRIKPSNLPDLLAQLEGKTNLETLEVGLAINEGLFSCEPYETSAKGYLDEDRSMYAAAENFKDIVAKLSEVKRSSPQCEISLSFSFLLEANLMAMIQLGRTIPNYIMEEQMLRGALFLALQSSDITALNVITNDEKLVSLMTDIARHNNKIQTFRLHLLMDAVPPEIGRDLSLAMVETKTPLSLECHIHPQWDSRWDGYEGNERLLVRTFTADEMKTLAQPIRTMMVNFATSGNAQSLRLIVSPLLAQIVLFVLEKNAEFDREQSDNEVSEASLGRAKKLLESGLRELTQKENFQVRYTVQYSRFEGKKTGNPSAAPQILLPPEGMQGLEGLVATESPSGAFDEFDILFRKNAPEEADEHPAIEGPEIITPESLRRQLKEQLERGIAHPSAQRLYDQSPFDNVDDFFSDLDKQKLHDPDERAAGTDNSDRIEELE